MDTNGYVSFGPNFGGLIIQWGNVAIGRGITFNFPIAFKSTVMGIIGDHYGKTDVVVHFMVKSNSQGAAQASDAAGENPVWSFYIAYGI